MFNCVGQKVCHNSLCDFLMHISEVYHFSMVETKHAFILSNVFLTNYCKLLNPVSSTEPKVKQMK